MKIAFTGNSLPWGEGTYYAGERVLYYLLQELSLFGHDLYVFSGKGTNIPKHLIRDFTEVPPLTGEEDFTYNAIKKYEQEHNIKFDIYACNYFGNGWNPKIIEEYSYVEFTYCRWSHIGYKIAPEKVFNTVSCSKCLQKDFDDVGMPTVMINYGIPKNLYQFQPKHENYVVFIGKIEGGKAPGLAIEIAKAAGRKIVVMGPPYNTGTFWKEVAPHIDNDKVFWVRGVDDVQKQKIMSKAFCFISSNENAWKEHFGIVNIEALAMGTPILGFNKIGQASAIKTDNIIENGKHGYLLNYINSNDKQYMVDVGVSLLKQIEGISREECRNQFENRFTSWHMAKRYEWLYKEAVAGRKHQRMEEVLIG